MVRALLTALFLMAVACGGGGGTEEPVPTAPVLPEGDEITVTSPAFDEGATIPRAFTCDGEDASPPLSWAGVPAAASTLRLAFHDLDAPGGLFLHWLVIEIDPSATGVARDEVPLGGTQAPNDFGAEAYGGPCPPEGDQPHRYVFTVDAFDGSDRPLGSGTLSVTYGR